MALLSSLARLNIFYNRTHKETGSFLIITIKDREWMHTGTTGVIPRQNLEKPRQDVGAF